jgi:hypothetical protein
MKKRLFGGLPPLLMALIVGLCASTCREEDPPPEVVAGYVKEFGTNKPIVGAQVSVSNCSGSFLGPISCPGAGTAVTNTEGYYEMPRPTITGAQVANAYLSGYFTDLDSETCVCDPSDDTDIVLYPHAWLRVKLVNESGAWGIYPEREYSWLPPLEIAQGDSLLFTDSRDLRKGNDSTNYFFSVRLTNGGGIPPADYYTTVKVLSEGKVIPFRIQLGAIVPIYLSGHDTTDLTIIY